MAAVPSVVSFPARPGGAKRRSKGLRKFQISTNKLGFEFFEISSKINLDPKGVEIKRIIFIQDEYLIRCLRLLLSAFSRGLILLFLYRYYR